MTLSADKLNQHSPYHSVTFKDVKYYTGLLMRHDHPMHDLILSSYQEFLKHVPERFVIREK